MKDKQQKQPETGMPPLPKSYQRRASMKWITIESLRVAMERLKNHTSRRVTFFTPVGLVEGELTEIAPSYSESFQAGSESDYVADITSMVANLRIDLLRRMENEEGKLELVDAAPLVGLKNVTVRSADQLFELPAITLFADQIIGFAVSRPAVH